MTTSETKKKFKQKIVEIFLPVPLAKFDCQYFLDGFLV